MKPPVFAVALFALILGSSAASPDTPEAKPTQPEYMWKAWDGDPKVPESLNFQLIPLSPDEPTQFLKLGDTLRGTKLKLLKFEQKTRTTQGREIDASELTLINTVTGQKTVLVHQ
jgi:hypothetical protein